VTEVDLVRVASVAAAECVRQRVDMAALVRLLDAWQAADARAHAKLLPFRSDVLHLAALIEPVKARRYRHHPVTFADGGTAAHHTTIQPAIGRMFRLLDEDTDPDAFVKAFLDVHPFADGNGRTAWVLWNWLRGTLHHPDPMPDFYGPRGES
jgi:hypothetical protein